MSVTPYNLFLMTAGAFAGIIVGAIPGLTATMAVALMVPVTFGMDMVTGIAMLIGVYAGGISGGFISACLLNIPGTPASVATTYDGYPMVLKGEHENALGIAMFSSAFGGLASGVALALLTVPLAQFALRFGPYEFFSLVILTFSCISSSSKGTMLKSFAGAGIGLLIATVGTSPSINIPRFTFGFEQLEGGFDLMPALIGMFALPQLLSDCAKVRNGEAAVAAEGSAKTFNIRFIPLLKSGLFLVKQYINFFRSAIIGIVIGILPGIGPALSNLVSYAQAKAFSKHPEKFGTGIPDGIIASETANNASMGGALIPTLALGIPGDSVTLMMLGAFMIHGFQPGPLMVRDNGPLVYGVFILFLIASLITLILQIVFMRFYARVLAAPSKYLIPILVIFCVTGCYATNSRMFDVWCFLGFGVLGYVLENLNIPSLPVIMGLILGPMAETQFSLGLTMSRGSYVPFLTRPLSAIMLFFAVAFIVWPLIQAYKRGRTAAVCSTHWQKELRP